ncbi:DUF4834 family protein [Flavicella sediminum]|uniref:DUF4834 family protein n=1 Tax=Flavicella sediminum TaxID=2585141 RepID=UPI00111CC416|nr:DUF4834 family protein [Flavicella sediminum]
MQEAGIITFFRTIGIILLVIYGLKFIARYVLPFVLTRAVKKAQERAQQNQSNYQSQQQETKVGETIIDKKTVHNKQSNTDNTVGEYVDYEEVD